MATAIQCELTAIVLPTRSLETVRALCPCGGAFEPKPGTESGMVARIVLPAMSLGEMAS